MTDTEIFVPRLEWLIGGLRIGSEANRYYGSCGTDPLKGITEQQIFNYSVYIDVANDEEVIKASWYVGLNSFNNTDEKDITTNVFPLSEDSLPEIKKWLESEAKNILG